MKAVVLTLCAAVCLSLAAAAGNAGEANLYATWEGFEVDKCATIWLIRRFADPKAAFRFFPRGTHIAEGTGFDVPDVPWRRFHNRSTFETVRQSLALEDPVLVTIGRIVNDIEINTWQEKAMPQTPELQEAVDALLRRVREEKDVVRESIALFDRFYEKLRLRQAE